MLMRDPPGGDPVSWQVSGPFVPLRIYRYQPVQQFGLHQDQSYVGQDRSRSLLTLMVYLNDDFQGGETDFPEQDRCIVSAAGNALWFQHMLLHAGHRVVRGPMSFYCRPAHGF